jgi:hypothetical protein
MIGTRIAVVLLCGVFLAGCASAHASRVARSETIGQTEVPERDTLPGVALSGGAAAPHSSVWRDWKPWPACECPMGAR